MDPDFVLILGFSLVVLTVIGFTVNGIVSKTLRHKKWLEEHRSAKSGAASSERQDALEERVRVLERIVTDKDTDLARQIEQLRDLDEIDQLTTPKETTRA